MKKQIQPSLEQMKKWIENYVPEKDFFFLQEKHLPLFEEELTEVLLIPKDEFFNHATYKQIQLSNSFEYWNLSKKVDFVMVSSADWVVGLPASNREVLFNIQVGLNRGLIFPLDYFSEVSDELKESTIKANEDEVIVVVASLWRELSFEVKEHLMKKYAQLWDEWMGEEMPEELPVVMKKYANNFPGEGGSNCLSATLFAVSRQEWMIHEWVHPQTFTEMLRRTHQLVETQELVAGDVVVWVTEEGQVQHASYHIGNGLFFNKNGQTFFNPWKIIGFSELQTEWERHSLNVYRRK